MRFNLKWLEEWVGEQLPADDLSQTLTMAGLEVDALSPVAKPLSDIVVGYVRHIEPHPDAERLKIGQVDVGGSHLLQIVCGASNIYEGMSAPVALVGGRIGDMEIVQKEIRGVLSKGMLCSATELGLNGDARSNARGDTQGLLDLGGEAAPGTDLVEYLALDDMVFEIDLTPNRGDCLSILGLAREVSALSGNKLSESGRAEVNSDNNHAFPLRVSAPSACPRYMYCTVTGLNAVEKIPLWLSERLNRCGVQSVHPVVDAMNYVMLELGQPLHSFDLDKIKNSVEVRWANAGERIDLLDGRQGVELDETTLLIADDGGPIAIAGIMGGSGSAVDSDTRNLLIECAYFSPEDIIGRARRYGLHTDASHRFERGVDFQLQSRALNRARELLSHICGGEFSEIREEVSDHHLPERHPIELDYETLKQSLCIAPDRHQLARDLTNLGMKVKPHRGGLTCTPPSFRFDLEIEEDLVEEVGRLYGYDKIEATLPSGLADLETSLETKQAKQAPNPYTERWADRLVSLGYHEAITYSFTDPEICKAFVSEPEAAAELPLSFDGSFDGAGATSASQLMLNNPVSPELSMMRPSLWPNLLKVLAYNLRRQQLRLRVFEIGRKFLHQSGDGDDFAQPAVVAGLVYGSVFPEQWGKSSRQCDFYDVKGDIERLLEPWLDDMAFEPCEMPMLHPGQTAKILVKGQVVGCVGMLHPAFEQTLDMPGGVFLFEIEQDKLDVLPPVRFEQLSRFPFIRRDISVIVRSGIDVVQLLNSIKELNLSTLKETMVFDVYTSDKLGEGMKSLAFGLIFQDAASTLGDEEVDRAVEQVIGALEGRFNAQIKGVAI